MVGKKLMNDGWEFVKLPPLSNREQALHAEWKRVQLPHDWLIWQTDDLYETADAWYRRRLKREEADASCVLVRFNGVYMDCDILLNGEVIDSHAYGYTAFDVDLTGKLVHEENELMVHIRHQSPNSRWYSGSGIYRDVVLCCLPKNHFVPDGIYTAVKRSGEDWEVLVEAEVIGEGIFECRLFESDSGKLTAHDTAEVKNGRAAVKMLIKNGKTWDPEAPFLYRLCCKIGAQEETLNIGLRELQFNPETGFWINGKHMKLRGVCNHHDLGALGAAFHLEAAARQLKIMQKMGANALRTSHNPPDPQVLELCDEMGIIVIDEIFDMWERPKTEFDYARFFLSHEADDVASWVRRDRNHPCVAMWSIGNEIYDMHADERGAEICRMLMEQTRRHDPLGHAAVTFGSNYMPWEGAQRCAEIVQIPGYNYAESYYALHHVEHPGWVIYGSETSSIVSSRNIYHFPASSIILSDSDLQCSSLGNSVTSWGARDLGKMLVEDLNTPYSMGQFIWSGIDYIGEPTPYHSRSSYFGQVDTAGFPKDSYFLIQSLWTDTPMIHIGMYWDWNESQLIDVRVMSNCASVELRLNGQSLGIQRLDRFSMDHHLARWQVPYEAGLLEAIGYNEEGHEICRDSRRSFSDTVKLEMIAEKESLTTDGKDMTFVTVQALDQHGTPVENARDRIHVSVSGGGVLLGLDNGDSTDADGYKTCNRRLFGGKLLIMIGSSGKNEPTLVCIRSGAGISSTLELSRIPCKKVADGDLNAVPNQPERLEIPVRRVEIVPMDGCSLNQNLKEARFAWKCWPVNADQVDIQWQIATSTGVPVPCAEIKKEKDYIRVVALGDGDVFLRALYGNAIDGHPEQISHLELHLTGLGKALIDPYEFVSAGLHEIEEGNIGAGNEKGISFAREGGWSLVGFNHVNFGDAGSDRITLHVFTLNDEPYNIRIYDGLPGDGGELLTTVVYQKRSIWNVYQPATYELPRKLTGIRTICFAADRKFHFKGFVFEKQHSSYIWHSAAEADLVYGDSFRVEGKRVLGIGNNVSLSWQELDFGEGGRRNLTIQGKTELSINAITLRLENQAGVSMLEVLNFRGDERKEQEFSVMVPSGKCQATFVFLPGSQFDFDGFSFSLPPDLIG